MKKITSLILLMFAVVAVNAETIYYKNNQSWSKVCAYCWGGEAGEALGTWPGTEMTSVEGQDGWVSIDLAVMPEKIIFNNGNNGQQTADLTLDADKGYYYNNGWTTSFTGTAPVVTNVIYYNNASTNWATVYAYTFGGAVGQALGAWPGTEMTAVADHAGWYSITIPSEVDGKIVFNNNDGKQTADLTMDADNVYYNGSSWQSSFEGGGVDPIEPSNGDYYLVGYINGADYGIGEDYENLGEYHFVNGKLKATFTQDSYVQIKTSDNLNWYMTQAYVDLKEGETATFINTKKGTTEKAKIPGGQAFVFTLAEQEDGSLLLSYVKDDDTALENVENVNYTISDGVLSMNLSSEQRVTLFTLAGNTMDSQFTMNYTRQLPQGIYFLRVGKKTQKIVVF